jgi:cytochrome c biogenesis protein CcmG, thiol:disulfide interchange protein DsbE
MRSARFLPLFVIALLGAIFAWQLSGKTDAAKVAGTQDPALHRAMPAITLPILAEDGSFSSASVQQPYLFNVFASWCAACRIEHGQLKALKEKTGLPLYGMAWKDKPENTSRWLQQMGNIYDTVALDQDGRAAIEIGLTGAPETYLVSKDGIIVAVYRGALSETVVQHTFLPAIEAMRAP